MKILRPTMVFQKNEKKNRKQGKRQRKRKKPLTEILKAMPSTKSVEFAVPELVNIFPAKTIQHID